MPSRSIAASKTLLATSLVLAVTWGCASDDGGGSDTPKPSDDCPVKVQPEEEIAPPPIHTPRWAFEPWISKDISNGPDTYAFVQGFQDRDIPVGVVVIDSPWETHYNTFIPNEQRYPEFGQMVVDLRDRDVRVVLWITQMVNNWYLDGEEGGDFFPGPAANFEPGQLCGFFVNEGKTYTWWKGRGAAVDFFNPKARAWWHEQQNALLDLGINGWKLDFGDSYVRSDPVMTAEGSKSHQAYSEAYYRDFYAYGAHRAGGTDEFITMARPWDESYDFEGRFFARPEHVPVAWVGDQRRDWFGLSDALDHIFRSAEAGYVVVGSDIGGYLDFDDKKPTGPKIPFDREVFERWVAMGAMTPFMQLHGRTNLTPWSVPGCDQACTDEVITLYRYWSKLHHELVPFFYSLAQEAYENGGTILHPQGGQDTWPGDYRFIVGEAFFVAPILDATGVRDVALPAGTRWFDWWEPSAAPVEGGTVVPSYDATPRGRIPLFVKEGAIVPLHVEDATTGLGTSGSRDALSVLVYPSSTPTAFRLHDDDDAVTTLSASSSGAEIKIEISRALREVIVRVRTEAEASEVRVGGVSLAQHADRAAFDAATQGWWGDPASNATWVKLGPATSPQSLVINVP